MTAAAAPPKQVGTSLHRRASAPAPRRLHYIQGRCHGRLWCVTPLDSAAQRTSTAPEEVYRGDACTTHQIKSPMHAPARPYAPKVSRVQSKIVDSFQCSKQNVCGSDAELRNSRLHTGSNRSGLLTTSTVLGVTRSFPDGGSLIYAPSHSNALASGM